MRRVDDAIGGEFGKVDAMSDKDGGPAFPTRYPDTMGMALWDVYAAAALTGVLTADPDDLLTVEQTAVLSAKIADAMLAERKKRGIGQ